MEMTLSVIYISKRENDLEMTVFTKYRRIAKTTIPFPKVGTVLSKNTGTGTCSKSTVGTGTIFKSIALSVPVLGTDTF